MNHLINYPIEGEESDDDDEIPQQSIELQFMYHRGFAVGCRITVHIRGTLFHGECVSCLRETGCWLITARIKESFALRNLEQIIRIEESHMSMEEWVSKYANDFPED
jgi:hypothetical protein